MYKELGKLEAAEYKLSGIKCERKDGERVWTLNGKKHRDDGPAVEGFFGHVEYWLNGVQVSKKDIEK